MQFPGFSLLIKLPIICLVLLMSPAIFYHVAGEVFSSVVDINDLIHAERKIIGILHNITVDKQAGTAVQSYIQKFSSIFGYLENANSNAELLVSHPLNAFRLIKYLSIDWNDLMGFIKEKLNFVQVKKIETLRHNMRLSGEEDLRGAAEGFVRLQKTYNIDTETFASGSIPGVSQTSALDTFECHVIGHKLAVQGSFAYAISWLELALRKYRGGKGKHTKMHKVAILDWLAHSYYHSGNFVRAHELWLELQAFHPIHKGMYGNIQSCQKELDKLSPAARETMKNNKTQLFIGEPHEILCREEGIGIRAKHVDAKLRCYYVTYGNPFLRIQPIKSEVVHTDPAVFLLHDIVLDSQVEGLKASAAKLLERAKVGAKDVQTNVRISKRAVLHPQDPVAKAVNSRLGHITNLDMQNSENLQVVNYGIGGYYEPHWDYIGKNLHLPHTQNVQAHLGDRMATVLMYLSEVEAGGATIFPLLNLTVFPQRGSALFWFNLHRDGVPDIRTLHEGCPVLSGNKWVFNKWVRERGQDVGHPCELTKDSDRLIGLFPPPR